MAERKLTAKSSSFNFEVDMSRKKPPKKFYELSGDRRTSAEIIAEARHSVRSLSSTTRPYTPAQQGRHLFGADGVPATSRNRPPSTFRYEKPYPFELRSIDTFSYAFIDTKLEPLD